MWLDDTVETFKSHCYQKIQAAEKRRIKGYTAINSSTSVLFGGISIPRTWSMYSAIPENKDTIVEEQHITGMGSLVPRTLE